MPTSERCSALKALIATGTSCSRSERFSAVTISSEMVLAASAAAAPPRRAARPPEPGTLTDSECDGHGRTAIEIATLGHSPILPLRSGSALKAKS